MYKLPIFIIQRRKMRWGKKKKFLPHFCIISLLYFHFYVFSFLFEGVSLARCRVFFALGSQLLNECLCFVCVRGEESWD